MDEGGLVLAMVVQCTRLCGKKNVVIEIRSVLVKGQSCQKNLVSLSLSQTAIGNDNVTVGYIMKPSREEDFMKRGAFPIYPTPNGLIFMPITFELSISSQFQEIDIVLHKATDEIVSIEMSTSSEFFDRITYSKGIQELVKYVEQQADICIVDPLNNIYPALDRLAIQQILLGLENLNLEGRCKIRAPHFLKVLLRQHDFIFMIILNFGS
ncbi:inositol-1,3,4-trisphosphate 5,6-kinase [Sarracenia purpurea var. burkii]